MKMKKQILAGLCLVFFVLLMVNKNAEAALSKSKPWYDFFPPIEGQPDEVRGVDPIKLRKTVRSWAEKHISTELEAGKRQQRWEGIITPYHLAEEVFAELNSNLEENSISMTKIEGLNEEIDGIRANIDRVNQEIDDLEAQAGGGDNSEEIANLEADLQALEERVDNLPEFSPAGVNGNVQFNDNGSFGGENNLNWAYDTDTLSVNGTTDLSNSNTLIQSGNMEDRPSTCSPGQIFVAYDGQENIQVGDCNQWGDINVRMYVCVATNDWEPVVNENTNNCS
jgi:hypothetical protein